MTPIKCPQCGVTTAVANARFCEECGASFQPKEPEPSLSSGTCSNCGASVAAIDALGFCSQCGMEQPKHCLPNHWELAISPDFAGVCDIGRRHVENEDYMALGEVGTLRVGVICDGISQSRNAGDAAFLAAKLVSQELLEAAGKAPDLNLNEAIAKALNNAQKAVSSITFKNTAPDDDSDAPATTALVACARESEVVLGWLGDCRAYWFGTDNRLITKDHSWINEVVDAGKLSYDEAIHRRGAHAVTRSLGGPSYRDNESDQPSLLSINLKGPGWLLLCSDGLWNYAPEPAEMACWVLDALNEGKGDALKMAQTLVDHGRAKGGKDNLTALLMHIK